MLDKDALLKVYPEYDKVLGPYKRGDGRKHVVLNKSGVPTGTKGKLKTISYPKAIVESTIGERLPHNATIDHLDRDKTNNEPYNLGIKERSFHCSEDAIKAHVSDVTCPVCGAIFTPSTEQRKKSHSNKAGPFCSRKCSGKYCKSVQQTGERKQRSKIDVSYYRVTD